MDTVPLTATARTTDKTTAALRQGGTVPCVLYGNKEENVSLECVYNEIYKAYVQAGASTIVDLNMGDRTVPVLFHQIQFDPVSDRIMHVDFYAVDMTKEIEATVPVHFEGEAPAVKDLGGVLVTTRDHVTVKCLPTKLPSSLAVSIESIVDFTSSITVADLQVPEGVAVQEDAEMMLATAQEPRRVEEVVEETAEGEGDEAGEGGEEKTEEGGEGGEEKTEEGDS